MFDHFRVTMTWLHTWSGLIVAWLLYFIFLTGSLGYFDTEIDRWMKPELPYRAELTDYSKAIETAQKFLNHKAASANQWTLELPESRNPYLRVKWVGESNGEAMFDLDGRKLEHRQTGGGQWLYMLHYRLHYLPIKFAYWIVCVSAMIMLVALITGIIIHKKIFIDFFSLRLWKRARTWLDLHNLLSVPALPFHIMITYSGLLFLASTYWPGVFSSQYQERPAYPAFSAEFFGPTAQPRSGIEAPVADLNLLLDETSRQWGPHSTRLMTVYFPNDASSITRLIRMIGPHIAPSNRLYFYSATSESFPYVPIEGWGKDLRMTLVNLHEGLFAEVGLRWLYFICGLISTGMIATGLIFWVEKRRNRKFLSGTQIKGFWLMERGNYGVLLGLPIAIIGYFWINRLIPGAIESRQLYEKNGFFAILAMCIGFSFLFKAQKSVPYLLIVLTCLSGLLPFVSDWSGGSGLLSSWRAADKAMLGFNVCFMFVAGISSITLYYRRQSTNEKQLVNAINQETL